MVPLLEKERDNLSLSSAYLVYIWFVLDEYFLILHQQHYVEPFLKSKRPCPCLN